MEMHESNDQILFYSRKVLFSWVAITLFVSIALPIFVNAETIWTSTQRQDVPLTVYSTSIPHWFATSSTPSVFLGRWMGEDFMTTASTSIHIWANWNGVYNNVLDVAVVASSGGDPFYESNNWTAVLVAPYHFLSVDTTSTLQEYSVPSLVGQTVHTGDEIWALIVPSWAAYGASHQVGSDGTTPAIKICEGDCTPEETPPLCTVNCNDSIFFLPGIESSRLYETDAGGNEVRLWEPMSNSSATALALSASGKSLQQNIYTRDVLDTGYGFYGMYDQFLATLNSLKSNGDIADWEAVPYDWRLSLEDILNSGKQTGSNISYTSATSSPFIIQELKRLAENSKSKKVTIVAHSNGGLVAKALVEKMGTDASKYIDKIVFVGVPQTGTPEAVAALLHGEGMGEPNDTLQLTFSKSAARSLAENVPSAYNLLPDENYFKQVSTPVVTFSATTIPGWVAAYGSSIATESQLQKFLTDSNARTKPIVSDTNNPNVLNSLLLTQSQNVHADLDAWNPPSNIDVYQIAGWGDPTTLATINYSSSLLFGGFFTHLSMGPSFVEDGDGVVVTPSALWLRTATNVHNIYFNLNAYNQNRWSLFTTRHDNMLNASALITYLKDVVTNSQKPLESYTYLSSSIPFSDSHAKRLQYVLRGPVRINLSMGTDKNTGTSAPGDVPREDIPGSYYREFGDSTYIFSLENGPQNITINSSTTTVFTITINEIQNNLIVASTTFKDIPVTPQTHAYVQVPSDLSSVTPLQVDSNGDGKTDSTVTPVLNGIAVSDTTAPSTTVAFLGTKGSHGWYTSDVLVTLSATDTQSSVAHTYYSLNDGSWSEYNLAASSSTLITKEGTSSLSYYSVDSMGNKEATSTITVRVDKTPPESTLTFDTKNMSFVITGNDNLSSTTVVTTATSTKITDDAGHTLVVSFSKFLKNNWKTDVSVNKLVYDGVATSVTGRLQYKFFRLFNKSYLLFASRVTASGQDVETHYRPLKNQTYLMTRTQDLDDSSNDDSSDSRPILKKLSGLVVPRIDTSNKTLHVQW